MRRERITSEQCVVLLNGVFQIDKYSYMPYRHPREYSETSTVVNLFRKIRRRIGIAESSFEYMNTILTSRNIDMAVRIRVLNCYVWSTLLYGCETWTLSSFMIKLYVQKDTFI